ncbi:C-type lectin domain family 12 member B-like [Calypte anna]|uniref:C-type lectin domain family 12 member B-like n=1 Tax=Calypte anna TaxID=9244 RepID=UPI0004C10DFD|nr:C-type lectin domain family 12 member B-like [Calypte anna]XP_030314376.1 C-type lectin domain family 12 member B-like [Calypte anna]
MTEEVTYADLKFDNSLELGNTTEPEDPKEKGPCTSSCSCQPVVLIFCTLCLVLLMALVTFAVLFFQIHNDYRTQLRNLNMTKNELHANFSNMLQAIGNQLCLEGEENLKNNGQNCALCPANWIWDGVDTCYYYAKEKKSWELSHKFCSSQNSTLLLRKEATMPDELSKRLSEGIYWLGLTCIPALGRWYWSDNTALREDQKTMIRTARCHKQCGYFYYAIIYSKPCDEVLNYICQKPAILLQRGNNHWQEDWFVRPK